MKNIEFEPHTQGGITLTRVIVDGEPVGMIGTIRDYISARIITPTIETIYELAASADKYTVIFKHDVDVAKKEMVNGTQHSDFPENPVFDKASEAIHYVTKRLEEMG